MMNINLNVKETGDIVLTSSCRYNVLTSHPTIHPQRNFSYYLSQCKSSLSFADFEQVKTSPLCKSFPRKNLFIF